MQNRLELFNLKRMKPSPYLVLMVMRLGWMAARKSLSGRKAARVFR